MTRYKNLCLSGLLPLLLFSLGACEDYNEAYNKKHHLEEKFMSDGKKIKVYRDSTVWLSKSDLVYHGRYPKAAYDSLKNLSQSSKPAHYVRVVVKEDFPDIPLTANQEYYARAVNYYCDIPARKNESVRVFVPYLGHMGFDDVSQAPYPIGASHKGRNIEGSLRFRTRILHIEYANGAKLKDTYFPCHPDSLIWHFVRREYNDD